jgi:hypothetical protein
MDKSGPTSQAAKEINKAYARYVNIKVISSLRQQEASRQSREAIACDRGGLTSNEGRGLSILDIEAKKNIVSNSLGAKVDLRVGIRLPFLTQS